MIHSTADAQAVIESMFSEPLPITGLVPAGATVGDPLNDPQLLAETKNHFWVQFDTGGGMQNADPTQGAHLRKCRMPRDTRCMCSWSAS